jgi:hypothetical protein
MLDLGVREMTTQTEIKAWLDDLDKIKPRPRPTLVCVNGRIVRDAVVIVSEKDPNWWRGMAVRRDGEIRVSRVEIPDRVGRRM